MNRLVHKAGRDRACTFHSSTVVVRLFRQLQETAVKMQQQGKISQQSIQEINSCIY
jgi:hypothetical protein